MAANEKVQKLLDVQKQLHAEFNGPAAVDRLAQFDAHIATAMMVIDCLVDEAPRMEGYKKS